MNQPNGSGLPANLANRQRRNVMADAVSGLGMARPAHISIRGGKFHLVNAAGAEFLVPTHHLDMIVVDANANTSRIYYEGPYDPTRNDPPACFSDNGTGPSNQSIAPQSTTCAVCPQNVRGSDTTFTGKPTTACERRKKIAVIIPNDPAVNVYEFQIPPGSLSGLKAYADWLGQQATGGGRKMDVADVITRVEWDPERQFIMTFKPVGYADDDRTIQIIDYIDANKLSDVAVGRNDVAHDPAQVSALLQGRPAAPQIAPAPQAPTPVLQLPPRPAATQALGAPAAPAHIPPVAPPPGEQAQPSQPRRRDPNKAKGPRGPNKAKGPEAQAPTTAPFMAPAQQMQNPYPPQPGTQAGQFAQATPQMQMPPVPDFLQRAPGPRQDAPAPEQRFGMSNPPAPPPGVQDALNAAMSLPTRR